MSDIWAILIGIVCGVAAGIPTSALIIMALVRQRMIIVQLGGENDERHLVS